MILPQLPIPLFYQSIFISATIILPFILLLLSVIFPEIFVILRRGNNTKAELEVEQDRILYHEAGHFLVEEEVEGNQIINDHTPFKHIEEDDGRFRRETF